MVTKKVGTTGRFGVRYGKRLRTKVLEVENRQKKKQACPSCERFQVKRLAAGIFLCNKCKSKFTGDAYFVKA
jgi:large subunit ribosomal protein L37Ae